MSQSKCDVRHTDGERTLSVNGSGGPLLSGFRPAVNLTTHESDVGAAGPEPSGYFSAFHVLRFAEQRAHFIRLHPSAQPTPIPQVLPFAGRWD
jgi:hypothetical protein